MRRAPSLSISGLKFDSRFKSRWIEQLGAHGTFDLEYKFGNDHLPRDTQAPADDSLSLLENVLREDEPSLWEDEHAEDVGSLREENARLRVLLVQLSKLLYERVAHAR